MEEASRFLGNPPEAAAADASELDAIKLERDALRVMRSRGFVVRQVNRRHVSSS